MNRRHFLHSTVGAGVAALLTPQRLTAAASSQLAIAAFRFDVTPPLGHPLCGGWIRPAEVVDDPLEAIGFVLTGAGKPIVICAVDWTGLLNDAHVQWRTALADGAGTTPDRVAVQCVHQHNAPFVCLEAEQLVSQHADLPHVVDTAFFSDCLQRGTRAVSAALQQLQPVTHVASGQAKVDRVAGNRRFLGPDGTVADWRASSSKNPRHKELPEGLIDPWMKTVAFYHDDQKLVTCHYYATHPMSYYGDGRVNSDFVGLARKRRQIEDAAGTQIYFTGCAGNVAAGKYNDGTPAARRDLTDRIYTAMVQSEATLTPTPLRQAGWAAAEILIPPQAAFAEEMLLNRIADPQLAGSQRTINAMRLSWLRHTQRQRPIVISALHVNDVTLLHLPAESFVEYQLRAQAAAPERFVATAAYGDGGPWYIPVEAAYAQGGYEVGVAFSAPAVDPLLTSSSADVVHGFPGA